MICIYKYHYIPYIVFIHIESRDHSNMTELSQKSLNITVAFCSRKIQLWRKWRLAALQRLLGQACEMTLMFSMSRSQSGKLVEQYLFGQFSNSVGPRSNSAWTSCNERLCKTCKASMKKTDFHAGKDCILATWPESQLKTEGTQASKCCSACNVCCFYASSKAKASKVSKANDVISHCSKHFLCNTFDPNKSCYGNGRQWDALLVQELAEINF